MPRPACRRFLLALLLLGTVAPAIAHAKHKPKPVACPAARYVVASSLLGGQGTDAVVLAEGKRIAIASGCAPVKGTVKATRTATKIAARWGTCGAFKRVQLKAVIRDDCQTLTGSLRAKKRAPTPIQAKRGFCGDTIVDTGGGEGCDPPGPTCRDTCQPLRCGDGIPDPGEGCDDGNAVSNDGCDANCTLPACGNGILNDGEQCDDGNLDNLDGCTVDCVSGTAPPFVRITSPANGAVVGDAPIVVSGLVQPGIVNLSVKGRPATIVGTTFTATGVTLDEGRNTLTATAEHIGGATGSDAISVTLDTTAPAVTIEAPRDHAIVSAAVVGVAGLVSDITPGVINTADMQVTVNGVAAPVTAGAFLASAVPLVPGRNAIVARAVDAAGNVGTREVVVTRQAANAGQAIQIVSGNEQSGAPGAALAPLVVRLVDALGNVMRDQPVRFRVTRGDGRFAGGVRLSSVRTGADGRAQVLYALGTRAGAGVHRVTVDAPGIVIGETVFCHSVAPGAVAMLNVLVGDTQTAAAGATAPSPLVVVARDDGGNPLAGVPITFHREQGTGGFPGRATTVQITTNDDGRAATGYVSGPAEGTDVIAARVADPSVQPAFFRIDAFVPGPPAATSFSGVVLDNANMPIAGAVVRVVESVTPLQDTTAADGRFRITSVPPGAFSLEVVGPTDFPTLHFNAFAVSGMDNSLPEPIYLPKVDVAGAQLAGDADVDVFLDRVPGVRLHIRKGSVRRKNGAHTALVSLTQVNQDKVPMPLPGGLAPRLVFSIQPPDASFDPPAELTLPNVEGLPPGFITEVLSYDHDLEEYVSRGTMTVSEDGTELRTDPGFGILKGGWHGGGAPPPPRGDVDGDVDGPDDGPPDPDGGPDGKPPKPGNDPTRDTTMDVAGPGDGPGDDKRGDDSTSDGTHKGGDDVIYATGELTITATDLSIPGRGFPFEMRRTYRSQYNYNGVLGHNWDFDYHEQLMLPDAGDADGRILRCSGASRIDAYPAMPDGSYESPPGRFDGLRKNPNGTYTIRGRDGFKRHFDTAGRLVALVDRHGNTMSFAYDAQGQLATVTDTLGRDIVFSYNAAGRLSAVTDFVGRQVLYSYDAHGDLVAVRTPVVVGTSTGNDFAGGKTTRYAYASGFDAQHDALNHDLLSITDPNGQRYLVNTYGTDPAQYDYDRVLTQQFGRPDQVTHYTYSALNVGMPADPDVAHNQTVEVDRNGNRRVYQHNALGNVLRSEIDTNRDVNPDDPASFVTTNTFDANGLVLSTTFPAGNRVDYEYDSANPVRSQQGNLLAETWTPGPRGGDQTQIRRTFSYEPIYHLLRTRTDPRGNAAGFVPPNGGSGSAARYTSTMTFDYQEDANGAALAAEMGVTAGEVATLLSAAGVALGLGDLNGDGLTDQIQGNVVRAVDPSVRLLADSQQATVEGGQSQPIVTTTTFNRFGQPTAVRDPAGNVDTMEYYPERDPDGDGVASVSTRTLANDTGGYLRATVRDAAHVAATPPLALRRETAYDEVGNLIRAVDGLGNATVIERNALNQVVREIARAPFDYEHRYFYDANGNVVREEAQNVDATGPDLGAAVVTTFTYDVLDRMLTRRDAPSRSVGLTTQYQYDRNENLVRVIQPEGNVEERVYDERDLVFLHRHGAGSPVVAVRTTTYDGNGLLLRATDGQDNNGDGVPEATSYTYDGFNRVVEIRDGLGNRTVHHYDPAGNRTEVQFLGTNGGPSPTDASGGGDVLLSQHEQRYDEASRVYQRDDLLFSNVAPVGADGPLTAGDGKVTRRTEFDRLGRVTRTVDDNGHQHLVEYDGADRTVRMTDQLGNETRYAYDANDNRVREELVEVSPEGTVPPESFVTTFEYDALDRLITTTDPLGNRTSRRWDSRNNPTVVRDALGNTHTYVHDGINRVLAESVDLRSGGTGAGDVDTGDAANADGRITTRTEWDGDGRVTARIDDNGNRTTIAYDALNRKVQETYADGTSAAWIYDRDDNVTQFTDQNGNVHANVYDAGNRLTAKTVARGPGIEGSTTWTFEYDGLGRITQATDDNDPTDAGDDSVVAWQWDSLSRLLVQLQDGHAVTSTFDGVGNRLAVTYPAGRQLQIVPDALDRLDQILDQGDPTPIVDYDYLGPTRVLERRFANGMRHREHDGAGHDIGYDGLRRMIGVRHETAAGTPIADFAYLYDRVGNRRYERDLVAAHVDVYQYDSAYRLTRAVTGAAPSAVGGLVANQSTNADVAAVAGTTTAAFRFDGVGNWVERATNGTPASRTVDAMNQYVTVGGVAQTYDDNGNLRDDGARQYRWDFANRLVRVLDGAGVPLARYRYDAFGRRIRRDVGAATTVYVNDGHSVIEERDGADTLLRQYVDGRGVDEHIELRQADGTRFFYAANVLGSTAAMTDESGAVVERYRYDVFGAPTILAPNGVTVRNATTIGNPYLFTGRRWDPESGLYHLRARYLHPQQGRFIHRDPRGAADGMNLYEYAGNNPVNLVDPMGTEKEEGGPSSPKKPCPPENSIRERARDTLWALAYEEDRIGGAHNFTMAYGAQDMNEHALFGEGAMMGMPATVPGMAQPYESVSAAGGRFLPKRNHQIFVPGYGEVDLRWLVQGYTTESKAYGMEGFGGAVKWLGGELYSLQYTIPAANRMDGGFIGSMDYINAHINKIDENTQINHRSFEMGRQLRDGTLLKIQTGEWEDRYGMRHPIYKEGTLEDFARMTVGDPPTNDRYKQSSDVPRDWTPELGKQGMMDYVRTGASESDDCK